MIEVIGDKGTSEYSAAESIAAAIEELWPGIATSPARQECVRVAANVKISGYRVSDIDVVACGVIKRERRFIPRKIIHDSKGKRVVKKPITVNNFVVVIEVKDHDESRVKITGDSISVKYSRGAKAGWKNATDQNVDQVHSLKHYLGDLGHDVYVHRCVFLRGLPSVNVGGAVGAGFDGVDFMTAVAMVSRVAWSAKGYTLSSGAFEEVDAVLAAPIFTPITPTALDRKRMDLITSETAESTRLLGSLGKKMVRLRGHGGTGKTVMCLQAAWKAFDEDGLRTLVLTYNHALAADIRRMMALLKIPSSPEEGGITVQTVMSFMYSWFTKLQTIDDEEYSFEKYEKNCKATHELLEAGAITPGDVESIIEAFPDRFDFDCVVVDEAQDWPQGEADLLKALYPPINICLADGIDQLVRSKRTDWDYGVPRDELDLIPLNRCLRMKRNLSVFVNRVAEAGGLKWKVTPNDLAGGGKVKILLRPYPACEDLHAGLRDEAKRMGNAELDFLFCVPSSSVTPGEDGKESDIGKYLSKAGFAVWDGVDELVRKNFPRSKNQFRVVQYASCRGLEGWTVVLHNVDEYWETCKVAREAQGLAPDEERAFEDLEDIAARHAWNQVMIALTRPIDTLVISLANRDSGSSHAFLKIADACQEFIEIID